MRLPTLLYWVSEREVAPSTLPPAYLNTAPPPPLPAFLVSSLNLSTPNPQEPLQVLEQCIDWASLLKVALYTRTQTDRTPQHSTLTARGQEG